MLFMLWNITDLLTLTGYMDAQRIFFEPLSVYQDVCVVLLSYRETSSRCQGLAGGGGAIIRYLSIAERMKMVHGGEIVLFHVHLRMCIYEGEVASRLRHEAEGGIIPLLSANRSRLPLWNADREVPRNSVIERLIVNIDNFP